MISFKRFFDQYLLREAFSLKQAKKKKLSRKYSGAYTKKTNEIFEGKDRLIFPITIETPLNNEHPILKTIREFLYSKGFDYLNAREYLSGVIEKDKQKFKIGRILQKSKDEEAYDFDSNRSIKVEKLLELFKTDPLRSAKNKDYYVVISRHPYDVAGSSTDRNWTSCMDLGTPRIIYKGKRENEGVNRKYVAKDIEQGTLVAYVVPKSELLPNGKVELRRPISRILMKAHPREGGKVYSMGKMYGNSYPEFSDFMEEWITEKLNSSTSTDDSVYFNSKLYRDSDEDLPLGFKFKSGNEIADKVLTDVLGYNNEKEIGNQITWEASTNGNTIEYRISMVFPFGEYIVRPFEEVSNIYKYDVGKINSEIERRLAATVFDEIRLQNIQTGLEMTSLGDGIGCEIDFSIHIGEDDKYENDDDAMWDTIYYSIDDLKKFDYKRLKQRLYKIVSEYDWAKDKEDKQKALKSALVQYKVGLDNSIPLYSSLEYIKEMTPFSPTDVIPLDNTQVKNLISVLSKIVNIFTVLHDKGRQYESILPWKLTSSPEYIDSKHAIFYNWAKENLGIDLADYRNVMKHNWNIKNFIALRPTVSGSQYEDLLDVKDKLDVVQRYIQYAIGDTGDIKI